MNELDIAIWYQSKVQSCIARKIAFELNLISFRNLAVAKRCYFTGLPLCNSTRTIDRVDNSLGYIKGNVVACHKAFNGLKSIVENPNNPLTLKVVLKGINKWTKSA